MVLDRREWELGREDVTRGLRIKVAELDVGKKDQGWLVLFFHILV